MSEQKFDVLSIVAHGLTLLAIMVQGFFLLSPSDWLSHIVLIPIATVIALLVIFDLQFRATRTKNKRKGQLATGSNETYGQRMVWLYLIIPLFSYVVVSIVAQSTHSYANIYYLVLMNAASMGHALATIKNRRLSRKGK